MIAEGDREYFARRLADERRMASEAQDIAARRLHIRLASEYVRLAKQAGAFQAVS